MGEEFESFVGARDEQMAIRGDILNSVILQQQKRIAELEHKFQASQSEIQRLKRSLKRTPRRGGSGGGAHLGVAKGSIEIRKQRSNAGDQPRYWTQEEHDKFLIAREKLGSKNYAAISDYVSSRTAKQVRTHAQKFEMRLARDSGEGVHGTNWSQEEAGTGSPVSSAVDFMDAPELEPAWSLDRDESALVDLDDDVVLEDLDGKWELEESWLENDLSDLFPEDCMASLGD